ncbi:MAG: hypothetical protein J1F04_09855 [Oscillospiraceae bacterium]|nr:hypothetical protein [Oscillospiraceae bacterium]
MLNFLRLTGINISRALRSFTFWMPCAVCVALMFVYTKADLVLDFPFSDFELHYLLRYGLGHGSDTFLLLVCTFSSAGLFAEEWCSGRFTNTYLRCGKRGYAAAQTASVFIISLLVIIISVTAYLLICMGLGSDIVDDPNASVFLQSAVHYPNGDLLVGGNYFAFFFLYALIEGCYAGLLAVIGFVFSIFLTNRYIAAVIPTLIMSVIDRVMIMLGAPFLIIPTNVYGLKSLYPWIHGNREHNLSFVSLIYPYAYTLIFVALLGIAAYFMIKNKAAKAPI